MLLKKVRPIHLLLGVSQVSLESEFLRAFDLLGGNFHNKDRKQRSMLTCGKQVKKFQLAAASSGVSLCKLIDHRAIKHYHQSSKFCVFVARQ